MSSIEDVITNSRLIPNHSGNLHMVNPLNEPSDSAPQNDPPARPDSWERVADELRACKESQKRAWGDLDNSTLGRYLAGEVADHELGQIERALTEHPELRQLTDLVRDVLGGLEPLGESPATTLPSPIILPLEQPRRTRPRPISLLRRYGALVAAACLLVALGTIAPQGGFLSAPAPRNGEPSLLGNALARSSPTSPTTLFSELSAQPDDSIANDQPLRGRSKILQERDNKESFFQPSSKRTTPPRDETGSVDPTKITASDAARNQRKGRSYLRKGDLVNAVPSLARAHAYCQDRLGTLHPYTTRTAQELARLYAPALNQDSPVRSFSSASLAPKALSAAGGTGALESLSPSVSPPRARVRKREEPATTLLREQIQNQSLAQVQNTVVPVLVRALQAATTPAERQPLVQALGNLGPAARPALPALRDCLNSAGSIEAQTIVSTLGLIGPSAIPLLMQVDTDKTNANSRLANNTLNLSLADRQLVRTTLHKLQSPEAQACVADEASCLTFRDIRTNSMQIRRLARELGIIVHVETRAGQKTAPDALASLKQLGQQGVLVLIDTVASTVEVRVCPALEKAGFSPRAIRDGMLDACKKKQFDRACDLGIQLIRQQAAGLKSARP